MTPKKEVKLIQKVDLLTAASRKTLSVEEFYLIPPVPFQRFTEGRAETAKVKKALGKLRPEHVNIELAELVKDCMYNNEMYKAGSTFIINGNTRKHFWQNGLSDRIPKDVHATVYKFETLDAMRDSYDTFDSMSAVERNQEKLYGILVRVHHFSPQCEKLVKGQFISGLNLACFYYDRTSFNQPSVTPEILPSEVALYIEEIKALDTVIKQAGSWDQALITAALMALKVHGTTNPTLLSCFDMIDRRAMNTTQALKDGATHISCEWAMPQKWKNKSTVWDKEGGLKQCTAFALYWINCYMEDKKLKQPGYNWEQTADTYFDAYHASMSNLNMLQNLPAITGTNP